MQLAGEVIRKTIAPGSKSERAAVVLKTAQGTEYVLRRKGGNAFADAELDQLVGRHIRAEGLLHGYTFVLDRWHASGS
jgi:hypothetical protein